MQNKIHFRRFRRTQALDTRQAPLLSSQTPAIDVASIAWMSEGSVWEGFFSPGFAGGLGGLTGGLSASITLMSRPPCVFA